MEHSTQNDAGVRHLAAENLPKTSLADLFYRDVDLDDALDLLAICRQA